MVGGLSIVPDVRSEVECGMPALAFVNFINKSGSIGNTVRKVARSLMELNARSRFNLFEKYIVGSKILDVGVGAGSMSKILISRRFKVVGVDVVNSSLYPGITAKIYDGENLPLKNGSMDTGLLICVLHHCSNPMKVLEETMRVCKRIVIIEDTYRNEFERFLVSARDSVGNFEFYHHDYHRTEDWIKIFMKLGWKSIYTKEWSSIEFYGMYGRQTLFVIEPND